MSKVITKSLVTGEVEVPEVAIPKIKEITGIADENKAIEEFVFQQISYFKNPQEEIDRLANE